MHEGEKDGVDLWLWLKIKYESTAKLDPLRLFYVEKIRSLKLKSGGSLHDYIDRFQGLEILWQAMNTSVHPGYRIVTQMFEQIEDPLLSGPCGIIKNWVESNTTFHNAAATLRAHEIGKLDGQTKKAT